MSPQAEDGDNYDNSNFHGGGDNFNDNNNNNNNSGVDEGSAMFDDGRFCGDDGPPVKRVVLEDVSAHVNRINIDGLARTKDDIVTKVCSDVFKAANFAAVLQECLLAKAKMEQGLGLFSEVGVEIDVTDDPNDVSNEGLDITMRVKEPRRFTGGVHTLVGNNDGSLMISFKTPNAFGRGEKLSVEYTHGMIKSKTHTVSFTKPINADPDKWFTAACFHAHDDKPWSGYGEATRGFGFRLAFPGYGGLNTVHWDVLWRELKALSNGIAFTARNDMGHSLKSALKHTYTFDTRDTPILPSKGVLAKFVNEISGLGGDVKFVKSEAEFQYNLPLTHGLIFQSSLVCGAMKSLNDLTRINDRFLLGGPLTLRGFRHNGVGPSEEGYALGGESYWGSSLHLYTPLPFTSHKSTLYDYFKTHFFVTAGGLFSGPSDFSSSSLRSSSSSAARRAHASSMLGFYGRPKGVGELISSTRLSYGLGLVAHLGNVARMELNYVWPIRAATGDGVAPGLQFGVGVSFF